MARKGWESLSPAYRGRLERGGISKADYERGESIKSARGHSTTPERPHSYSPKEFPKYHSERQRLNALVAQKKQEYFGASPKWNPGKGTAYLSKYAPSLASLRWAYQADYEDWLHAIREDPEAFAFLGYH